MSDADLGAMVAYVTSMPAVAGQPAQVDFPLPVRLAYGFGAIRDAAARIDHALPAQPAITEAPTVE